MRRLLLCTLLTLFSMVPTGRAHAAQASPAIDPEKAELIRQILDATHAADQMINVMEANLPAQRAALPQIPPVFWDRFMAQVRQRRGELIDSIIPIWNRVFTLDDLRGLLNFYKTPLGQRLIEVQPGIVKEATEAGQRWGAQLGADVGRQLAAEGVKLGP